MDTIPVQASAPAKLVILGEYAVLDGAQALVAAIDRRVHVEITPLSEEAWVLRTDLDGGQRVDLRWEGDAPILGADARAWASSAARVIRMVLQGTGVQADQLPGCDVNIQSRALHIDDGKTKLGLGSSAAVVVALAEALRLALRAWRLDPTAPDAQAAYEEDLAIHHELQFGLGSGIDVAASFHGGLRTFERGEGAGEIVSLPTGVEFRMVWTGSSASTPAFLRATDDAKASDPAGYRERIDAIREAAGAGIEACRQDDAQAFLSAVRHHERAMAALGDFAGAGIVSSVHARVAAIAKSAGSAYKPSGAGGGDVGLLFATSPDALGKTTQRIEEAGYRLVEPAIDTEGVVARRHERHTT